MASIKEKAAERRREAQVKADQLEARAVAARQIGARALVVDGSVITCMEDLQKELYAQGLGPDWHSIGSRIDKLLSEGQFTLTLMNEDKLFACLPGGFLADLKYYIDGCN